MAPLSSSHIICCLSSECRRHAPTNKDARTRESSNTHAGIPVGVVNTNMSSNSGSAPPPRPRPAPAIIIWIDREAERPSLTGRSSLQRYHSFAVCLESLKSARAVEAGAGSIVHPGPAKEPGPCVCVCVCVYFSDHLPPLFTQWAGV